MAFNNSLVEVGIAITLRDQFSRNTGQIAGSFRSLMDDLRTAAQAAQQAYGSELDAMRAIGSFGIDAYKSYAEVGKDVYLTTSMIKGSQEEYNRLLKEAREINLEVPLTTKDISSAQRYMAMAGLGLEEISAMTKPVAQIASLLDMTAGQKGGVADILTNIMATFRLGADDVVTVADDLFTAVTNTNMSFEDLGNAIKMAGSEATISGISVQETAAAIGLLGDMGIQGSAAGTALANTFRYLRLSLSGQKEKGYKALQALGLSKDDFYDAQGNLKSLHNTYKVFADAVTAVGMTNDEIGEAFYNIFGVRGERNMLLVMQQMMNGTDKMSIVLDEMRENAGVLQATMDGYNQTAQGQIDMIKSNWDAFKVNAGEALAKIFSPLLEVVNTFGKWFNGISDSPIAQFLIRGFFVLAFHRAFVLVGKMGRTFMSTFTQLRSAATTLAASGASFNRSIQSALTAMLLMNQASMGLKPGQRLPLGMMNGAPAYLTQTKRGLGLSYVAVPGGNRGVVTNQTRMAGILTGTGTTAASSTAAQNASRAAARNASKISRAAGGATRAMTSLGKYALGAIPVVGNLLTIGFLLYDGISLLTDSTDANTEEMQEQRRAEEEKQQQLNNARIQVMNQLAGDRIALYSQMGILTEVLDELAKHIAEGGTLNLNINGQDMGRVVNDQVVDVTQAMLTTWGDSVASNLHNMGY